MAKKSERAAQGSGSIRKKTVTRDGRTYTYWEGRITTGRDPGTGKQVQRSFTGKTQKEVREKIQAAAVELNTESYSEPSKMSLSDWVDIWLKDYTGDKKYLTVKAYTAQCNTHIKPALGNVKLSKLSPLQIQEFYNNLLREGKAPKTIHNVHGILSKCLSTAVQIGLLHSNPAEKAILPKVPPKEIKPLTDEQVSAFLIEVESDEYEFILKTILFTGMRESEAIGLTWDCVNFKDGTLKICKQLQKRPLSEGGFTFAPLKNDKTRIIKPAPSVMDLLKQQQKKQAEQRLKAGSLWVGWQDAKERSTAFVFTTATGTNVYPQTLYKHYKKIAAKIGAPDSRVHDLRHTYAVLSLQNGDDIKTVQGNLGHATAAFTLDVYGHVSDRMKDESSSRMEAYIQSFDSVKGKLKGKQPNSE